MSAIDSWPGAPDQAGGNPEEVCEDDDITSPVPIVDIFCSVSRESLQQVSKVQSGLFSKEIK